MVHGSDCRMATRCWFAPSQANSLAYCAWGRVTGSIKTELQRKQEGAFRCVTSLNAEALESLQLNLLLPVTDNTLAGVAGKTGTPEAPLSGMP